VAFINVKRWVECTIDDWWWSVDFRTAHYALHCPTPFSATIENPSITLLNVDWSAVYLDYPVATKEYTWRAIGPIIWHHDVIRKTGNAKRITTPPEMDRATATVNVHKNFVKFARWPCGFWDMSVDRQTDKHACHNTSQPFREGGVRIARSRRNHLIAI